jgi:mono/diheme cytochrome c family protein
MLRSLVACAFLAGITLVPSHVRGQGNPEVGQDLAADWCSRCHDIGREGQMKQEPPSFAAIAAYRSAEQIRSKIMVPHTGMPEVAQVLGLNVDDLVAYIVSLEEE